MSSSDSWTLIGLTILVVLLLFYLSKKMIGGLSSGGNDQLGENSLGSATTTTTVNSTSAISAIDLEAEHPYPQYYQYHQHPYLYQFQHQYGHYQQLRYYLDEALANLMQEGIYNGDIHTEPDNNNSFQTLELDNPSHYQAIDTTIGSANVSCPDNTTDRALMVPIDMSVSSSSPVVEDTTTQADSNVRRCSNGDGSSSTSTNSTTSCTSNNTNTNRRMDRKDIIEAQLRTQIVRMIQAEREIRRLTYLLSIQQGLVNGEDYIATVWNNLLRPHHQFATSPTTTTTATTDMSSNSSSSRLNPFANTNTNTSGGGGRLDELILSAQSLSHDENDDHGPVVSTNLDSDQPPPYDQCVPLRP